MNSRIARMAWTSAAGLLSLNAVQAQESVQTVDFDNTTGLVVEGEYRTSSKLGFKLRHVSEKYDAKAPLSGVTVDGSHIGLLMNWYL